MSQKSNLTSLTRHTTLFNLINLNSQIFLKYLSFIQILETLLQLKNIIVTRCNFVCVNNVTFINIFIFFCSKKLITLKKKLKKKSSINCNYPKFTLLLNNLCCLSKTNLYSISFFNLNYKIKKKPLLFFYSKLKKVRQLYFQRVFNLFIDFIKISYLFYFNKISSKNFLLFICLIFRSISKKLHVRFIYFLKSFFLLLISKKFKLRDKDFLSIQGIKFIISGRLRDKQRSSFICLQEGRIPITNLKYGVDFSKMHVHTIYGVFGLKIWVFRLR